MTIVTNVLASIGFFLMSIFGTGQSYTPPSFVPAPHTMPSELGPKPLTQIVKNQSCIGTTTSNDTTANADWMPPLLNPDQYSYWIEGGQVCSYYKPIPGAEAPSLMVSKASDLVAKDKNHVYIWGTVIPGADPNTFKIVPSTQVNLGDGYGEDSSHVWYLANSESFDVFPGADPSTLTYLGTYSDSFGGSLDFFKDRGQVYTTWGNIIQGADPKSFVLVRDTTGTISEYEKDTSHVYFGAKILSGADPATFVAIACSSDPGAVCTVDAKDKNHTYLNGQIVE